MESQEPVVKKRRRRSSMLPSAPLQLTSQFDESSSDGTCKDKCTGQENTTSDKQISDTADVKVEITSVSGLTNEQGNLGHQISDKLNYDKKTSVSSKPLDEPIRKTGDIACKQVYSSYSNEQHHPVAVSGTDKRDLNKTNTDNNTQSMNSANESLNLVNDTDELDAAFIGDMKTPDMCEKGNDSACEAEAVTPCTEGDSSCDKDSPLSMSPEFPSTSPRHKDFEVDTSICEGKSSGCSGDNVVNNSTATDYEFENKKADKAEAENSDLSLSDKENSFANSNITVIKDAEKDTSPGFMSMCKAFAGKVVDFVKTSPSYLTGSFSSKSDCSDVSASPVLAVKHISILKQTPDEKNCPSDSSNVIVPETQYIVCNAVEETDTNKQNSNSEQHQTATPASCRTKSCNFESSATGSARKSRDHKMFFDTFNSVSKELSKGTNKPVKCLKGDYSSINSLAGKCDQEQRTDDSSLNPAFVEMYKAEPERDSLCLASVSGDSNVQIEHCSQDETGTHQKPTIDQELISVNTDAYLSKDNVQTENIGEKIEDNKTVNQQQIRTSTDAVDDRKVNSPQVNERNVDNFEMQMGECSNETKTKETDINSSAKDGLEVDILLEMPTDKNLSKDTKTEKSVVRKYKRRALVVEQNQSDEEEKKPTMFANDDLKLSAITEVDEPNQGLPVVPDRNETKPVSRKTSRRKSTSSMDSLQNIEAIKNDNSARIKKSKGKRCSFGVVCVNLNEENKTDCIHSDLENSSSHVEIKDFVADSGLEKQIAEININSRETKGAKTLAVRAKKGRHCSSNFKDRAEKKRMDEITRHTCLNEEVSASMHVLTHDTKHNNISVKEKSFSLDECHRDRVEINCSEDKNEDTVAVSPELNHALEERVSGFGEVGKITDDIALVKLTDISNECGVMEKPSRIDENAVEEEEISAPVVKKRRRRSADAATIRMQMLQEETTARSAVESSPNLGPKTQAKAGRKRKLVEETYEQIEKIYHNKNFVKPEETKPWQTIFEVPDKPEDLYGKQRKQRFIDFEKPTQLKLKRRLQKAVKNGWDPKKKRKTKLGDDFVKSKLDGLWAELDSEQKESLEEKLQSIIETK